MTKMFTWRCVKRRYAIEDLGYPHNQTVLGKAAGLLYNPGALWIGAHYSPANRRWCINLVPCFTVWYTNGGYEP